MRRRAAPGRDVHVDEAITAAGVGARDQDGLGVFDEADVRQAFALIGSRDLEITREIVRG